MTNNTSQTQNISGVGYFFKGFELIQKKGIKRFVFIPLFINLVLFSVAFYYLYMQLDHYMTSFTQWLPSWLDWLSTVLWPLVLISVNCCCGVIFIYI